ncbi:MAG: preprotein translocase subunit SecG [Candidatus Cloacimonetes bacterium]|nr:preprotein translocase subunit SecG [Candidatus Cloacimonadota bacterium]
MLNTVLLIIHVIVALATVLVILMQTSKGNGLDSTFGGAAGQVLGGQNAPLMLKKLTRILVAAFFILCILLAFQKQGQRQMKSSAVQKLRETQQKTDVQPMEEPAPLEAIPVELPAAASDSL